jgi:hypothetical protein
MQAAMHTTPNQKPPSMDVGGGGAHDLRTHSHPLELPKEQLSLSRYGLRFSCSLTPPQQHMMKNWCWKSTKTSARLAHFEFRIVRGNFVPMLQMNV